MDLSPVTMMSTIHPPSSEDALVPRMRQHSGNMSINPSGANFTSVPGEFQKQLDIQAIVENYNQHKVGVDMGIQY